MTNIEDPLAGLRDRLAHELSRRGMRMATAESCTGGWIAKLATDMPGSSDWFECGIVCYSNTSKHRLLGVPAETIEHYGAVSEQTVLAMLAGLFRTTDADIGVAVSGIAGPGGGTPDKPVGTVWIAYGGRNRSHQSQLLSLTGDRNQVREQAVASAIGYLLETINN